MTIPRIAPPADGWRVVMDWPEAWAFVRNQTAAEHDPRCSWIQTNGALLCDCRVLWDEYDRRKAAQAQAAAAPVEVDVKAAT